MATKPGKMSDIMLEMAQVLLREPSKVPTSEAAHVALFFATAAWNESVGLTDSREGYRHVWETIEAENPELWNEFKSNDINAMIDELVEYKKAYYPNDERRILTCGMRGSNVHVEWIPAVAPGADSRWEMQLYGLLRSGQRQKAIRFFQETRSASHKEAVKSVAEFAARLGMS
jgi:hypothetical protein